jgi:transposase-like protein
MNHAPMTKPTTETSTEPEGPSQTRRRTFTGEYRAKILAQADAATEPGAIGEILRREGLYSSHLVDWRRRRAQGGAQALASRPVGRPRSTDAQRAESAEIARLQAENAALSKRLLHAEIIIEAQKKLAEVLGLLASTPNGSSG